MNYKVGDRVKYTSDAFGDSTHNPLWGGHSGKIIGTIRAIAPGRRFLGEECPVVTIRWDCSTSNEYRFRDIEHYHEVKPITVDERLFDL